MLKKKMKEFNSLPFLNDISFLNHSFSKYFIDIFKRPSDDDDDEDEDVDVDEDSSSFSPSLSINSSLLLLSGSFFFIFFS